MTILAMFAKPHEVIVASDTIGAGPNGEALWLSKLRIIPHLNALLAGRGNSFFFETLQLRCLSANVASFDALLAHMPAYIAEAFSWAAEDYELLVVGWSAKAERMVARVIQRRNGHEQEEDADTFVAPWDVSMQAIPKIPERLEYIASAQVRWMKEQYGDAAAGGMLNICRATRRSIALSHASIKALERRASESALK